MPPTTLMPRCVIADDLRAFRKILESWIEECGFECCTSSTAEEAWNAIIGSKPTFVITDIEMPGASGLDLLYSLRSHPSTTIRSLPVIVISSLDDADIRKFVHDLGGTCFLSKPLGKRSTQRAVRGVTGLRTVPNESFLSQFEKFGDSAKRISPTMRRLYSDVKRHGPRFH